MFKHQTQPSQRISAEDFANSRGGRGELIDGHKMPQCHSSIHGQDDWAGVQFLAQPHHLRARMYRWRHKHQALPLELSSQSTPQKAGVRGFKCHRRLLRVCSWTLYPGGPALVHLFFFTASPQADAHCQSVRHSGAWFLYLVLPIALYVLAIVFAGPVGTGGIRLLRTRRRNSPLEGRALRPA